MHDIGKNVKCIRRSSEIYFLLLALLRKTVMRWLVGSSPIDWRVDNVAPIYIVQLTFYKQFLSSLEHKLSAT